MSGLINSLFPPLDALDLALAAVMPPLARLVLYGALSGAVTMLVYRLASNQEDIRAQKARMRELQGKLKAAQDDFAETMRLSRQNLAVSFRLLGMSLWPALLSSLPVIVLFAWLAMRWSQPMPPPGTAVPVAYSPAGAGLSVGPPGTLADVQGAQVLRWPGPDAPATITDTTGVVYDGLGARPAVSALRKQTWWNWLLGSPGGYLPDRAALDEVRFELPQRQVLDVGPSWARGFELAYFATVMVVSLAIKIVFRIA